MLGKDTSDTVSCRIRERNNDVIGAECTETAASCHNCIPLDHPVFASFVRPTLAHDGSLLPAKVTVSDAVSLSAFRVVLHFLYAGRLPPLMAHWCPPLHHLGELLQMPSLVEAIANISIDEDFLNVEIYRSICEERYHRTKGMLLQDGLFSGIHLCTTTNNNNTTIYLLPLNLRHYGAVKIYVI